MAILCPVKDKLVGVKDRLLADHWNRISMILRIVHADESYTRRGYVRWLYLEESVVIGEEIKSDDFFTIFLGIGTN